MSLQSYQTLKVSGVKNLILYLKNNQSHAHQIDSLLKYFPMFDNNRDGVAYTFQVFNGFSPSWENSLYTVIILYNNQIAGYGQLLLRKHFAELFNVIVHSDLRKKGLGKEIISELEDYAIKNNKNDISLWCENHVKSFYSQFNYRPTKKENIVEGFHLYQMKKKIVDYEIGII